MHRHINQVWPSDWQGEHFFSAPENWWLLERGNLTPKIGGPGIDEVEMTTWIREKMWKSYRVGHFNKARRGSFSSSSALWSCFKSNNVFSVIHLRSSLNGSKISALIRLPTIWSQQRHNGTKGRSIEIRSQFASTPWFGSFQNQVTKTFFSILYQIRFNENGCLNSKIQSVLPTSSTCSKI